MSDLSMMAANELFEHIGELSVVLPQSSDSRTQFIISNCDCNKKRTDPRVYFSVIFLFSVFICTTIESHCTLYTRYDALRMANMD